MVVPDPGLVARWMARWLDPSGEADRREHLEAVVHRLGGQRAEGIPRALGDGGHGQVLAPALTALEDLEHRLTRGGDAQADRPQALLHRVSSHRARNDGDDMGLIGGHA